MKKFDGSNLFGWVTQMEHHLSFHGIIDDVMKPRVGFYIWIWNIGNGGNIKKKNHSHYNCWTHLYSPSMLFLSVTLMIWGE